MTAGNDSVKPQTEEAITHAKAANVPIIVAMNKIDLDAADLEKVKGDLAKHELVSEEWGGKVQMIPVSATTKKGIDNLLDAIELESEMLELKAPIEGLANGVVSRRSRQRARLSNTRRAHRTSLPTAQNVQSFRTASAAT